MRSVLIWSLWLLALALGVHMIRASARDLGQWENIEPQVKAWFEKLLQPDTIGQDGRGSSCCGEADAYWADEIHVVGNKVFVTVTDDRDDKPLMRTHVDVGTVFEIPPGKIVGYRQRLGNPTGHSVLFLGSWTAQDGNHPVLCFVQSDGV